MFPFTELYSRIYRMQYEIIKIEELDEFRINDFWLNPKTIKSPTPLLFGNAVVFFPSDITIYPSLSLYRGPSPLITFLLHFIFLSSIPSY